MSNNNQENVSPEVEAEAKNGLKEWFSKPQIKRAAGVIVPGAIAALLFPVLGPTLAAIPGAIAVQNGLKLFGIKWSGETLMKIVQKQPLDESDMRNIMKDLLKEPEVNKEAAETLTAAAHTVVEAVKESPQISREELANIVSKNMAEQGGALEKIAHDYDNLLRLDGSEFDKALETLRNRMVNINQEQIVKGSGSLIEDSGQGVRGNPSANTTQSQKAEDGGQIKNSKQIVDFNCADRPVRLAIRNTLDNNQIQ